MKIYQKIKLKILILGMLPRAREKIRELTKNAAIFTN
jgi:hypothetical protein